MDAMDIDYSDLEAKYATSQDDGLDRFVVVDGAPVAPAAKVDALTKVLKKVFTKAGPLKEPHGFYMPTDDTGKTQGFVFLEFATDADARNAIKMYNGKKLDAKHTLFVDRLANVERYTSTKEKTSEEIAKDKKDQEFKPLPHFRSWLTDSEGRDQAIIHVNDDVGVYWIRKDSEPKEAVFRPKMTEEFTRWSPKGTFMLSTHVQGVVLYGGPEFEVIARFPHRDVRFVDFSPDERYLVTSSPNPIPAVPEDPVKRAQWPFKESDEGNNIVIWDTQTFVPLRTFPLLSSDVQGPDYEPPARLGKSVVLAMLDALEREKRVWPAFKWSSDSKYFARISATDTLSVYETPSMALLDKKPIRVPGIEAFEFAPSTVRGRQLLVYWTPEIPNSTARMCIMDIPSKEIIRNRSLFNVSSCKIFWQDEGNYLCVKIDRLNKNKKTAFSSLELYSLADKTIPVEVVDLKDVVTEVAWEPRSDRFVCLSYPDVSGQPLLSSKNILSFYAYERNKGNQGVWKEAYRFEHHPTNLLLWSPKGRFLATGIVKSPSAKPSIEFWDVDHEGPRIENAGVGAVGSKEINTDNSKDLPINLVFLNKVDENSFGMTDAAWDPSGRYVATWSSIWRQGGTLGYRLWDATGNTLRNEKIDKFKAFLWRPRPASILPKDKKKEINKGLKALSAQFDLEDRTRAVEESAELQRKRDDALEVWRDWRARQFADLGRHHIVSTEATIRFENGTVHVYAGELLEQEEEVEE